MTAKEYEKKKSKTMNQSKSFGVTLVIHVDFFFYIRYAGSSGVLNVLNFKYIESISRSLFCNKLRSF